jgi:hypothetical protein
MISSGQPKSIKALPQVHRAVPRCGERHAFENADRHLLLERVPFDAPAFAAITSLAKRAGGEPVLETAVDP